MLLAALAVGQRIGPVFPTVAGKPNCRHGVHDATRDPDGIKRLWARCPESNVSVAMGRASGLLGLDVDHKGGRNGIASLEALVAEFGPIPETARYRTPNDGLGYLFKHPGGDIANRFDFRPGLEIHSDGLAMTLPPSQKDGRRYTWIRTPRDVGFADPTPWLLAVAAPPPPPPRQRPTLRLDSFDRMGRYVATALDQECATVSGMPAGSGRNRQLFIAAAKLGELIGADLLHRDMAEGALEEAAQACGLAAEDGWRSVRATIASGLNRGVRRPRQVTR
jgi:hypothetical protein